MLRRLPWLFVLPLACGDTPPEQGEGQSGTTGEPLTCPTPLLPNPNTCGDGVGQPGELCFLVSQVDLPSPASFLRIGDLDGDGPADLLAGYNILTGDGDGGFVTSGTLTGTTAFAGIALGDLNDDDQVDTITAHAYYSFGGPDDVHELVARTAGPTGSGTTISLADYPGSVATGDLDGDGQDDLVYQADIGDVPHCTVHTLLDPLNAGPTSNVDLEGWGMGTDCQVRATEATGDELVDILTWGADVGFRLAAGAGDGTAILQGGSSESDDPFLLLLEVSDLDCDGQPDVVGSDGTAVVVYRGEGAGVFTRSFPPVPYARSIALGDLNADEVPDLVVSGDTGVAVLPGLGNGEFAAPMVVEGVKGVAGPVDLADVDQDGDLDLIAVRESAVFVARRVD